MINAPLKSSSSDFSLHPLFWLSVCLAIGIFKANYLLFSWQISLVFCAIFATLCALLHKQKVSLVFLFLCFIFAGAFVSQIENQQISPNRLKLLLDENKLISGEPVEIEGVMFGNPELTIGGFFLELRSEKVYYKENEFEVSGNLRLFAPLADEQIAAEYENLNLRYGSRIRVGCHLKREENFQNPGVVSTKKFLIKQVSTRPQF